MNDTVYPTDLLVLNAWLRNRGLAVEMREHPSVATWRRHPDLYPWSMHQLFVRGERGEISVIRGWCTRGRYEIYCLDGDLFDDTYSYDTVKEAGEAICRALEQIKAAKS